MSEQDDKKRELERLTKRLREGTNFDARAAIDEIRHLGWLADGSLHGADLSGAKLTGIYLGSASLVRVNFSRATLMSADLSGAWLDGANLTNANLQMTNLSYAKLYGARLTNALCMFTIFGDVDLSGAIDLHRIQFSGPSVLDTRTLYKSRGKIPEVFLRGCGVPEDFIEFTRGMFNKTRTYAVDRPDSGLKPTVQAQFLTQLRNF